MLSLVSTRLGQGDHPELAGNALLSLNDRTLQQADHARHLSLSVMDSIGIVVGHHLLFPRLILLHQEKGTALSVADVSAGPEPDQRSIIKSTKISFNSYLKPDKASLVNLIDAKS